MTTPPARTELADTYPLPSNATFRTGIGKLWDYATGLLGTTGTAATALATLGAAPSAGLRNIIINPGFTINQRVYASAAVLASGAFGHDRWKAGSGGGDYSFTQLASNTQITIAANKTLIQVVENANVDSAAYVLQWKGTALARYAINSATPAGSYAASPILITGQTPGTTMSVEFGNGASAGTLGKVQLRAGTVATVEAFEPRPVGMELALCQRYYCKTFPQSVAPAQNAGATGAIAYTTIAAAAAQYGEWLFPVLMRAAPTAVFYNPSAANGNWRNASLAADSNTGASVELSDRSMIWVNAAVGGDGVSQVMRVHVALSAEL